MADPLNLALSIDGTHCPIQEPEPFNHKWYSQKLGCAAVNYMIVLKIDKSWLVWVNGPFPAGSMNNIKTFREKGLKEKTCWETNHWRPWIQRQSYNYIY